MDASGPGVYLFEPSAQPDGGASAGFGPRARRDAESLASAVTAMRARSTRDLERLVAGFRESVERAGPASVTMAADGREAARHVAAAAAGATTLLVNQSSAVRELVPHLRAGGISLIPTYLDEFPEFERRVDGYWSLFAELPDASARNLASRRWRPARRHGGTVCLLGVSAASASDGAVYLLQHMANVGRMLRGCRTVILLVPIDKIVGTPEDARLQIEAMGVFGVKGMILDLPRMLRRTGDGAAGDGPEEDGFQDVHVVILDNGRSRLPGTPYERLLDCIACRRCITHCPTYPYFRGERGLNPREYVASSLRDAGESLDKCLYCWGCEAACPLGIPIPQMVARRRAEQGWVRRMPPGHRLLANFEWLGRMGSRAAPIVNRLSRPAVTRALGAALLRIDPAWRPPAFASTPFGAGAVVLPPLGGTRRGALAYFYGCYINFIDPGTGQAVVDVLRANGFEVRLPPQVCCGMPLLAAGDHAKAAAKARANLRWLAAEIRSGCRVVVSCPSCELALKKEQVELSGGGDARLVSDNVVDASQLLADLHRRGDLAPGTRPLPIRVGYHLPCHLRPLGVGAVAREYLAAVPGLAVDWVDRGCCGLAGTFGLKRENRKIVAEVAAPVFAEFERGRFDVAASECGACRAQLEQGTGLVSLHPIALLAASYGLAGAPRGAAAAAR